jgi:hypothetical protein
MIGPSAITCATLAYPGLQMQKRIKPEMNLVLFSPVLRVALTLQLN